MNREEADKLARRALGQQDLRHVRFVAHAILCAYRRGAEQMRESCAAVVSKAVEEAPAIYVKQAHLAVGLAISQLPVTDEDEQAVTATRPGEAGQ